MTDHNEWRTAPSGILDANMAELASGVRGSKHFDRVEVTDQGREPFPDADELDELQWALAYDESDPLPDLVKISARLALPQISEAASFEMHPEVTSAPEILPASDNRSGTSDADPGGARGVINSLLLALAWEARPLRLAMRKTSDLRNDAEITNSEEQNGRSLTLSAPGGSFEEMPVGTLLEAQIELVGQLEQSASAAISHIATVGIAMLRPTADDPYQFRASLTPAATSDSWNWVANVQIFDQSGLKTRGTLSSKRKVCYLAGNRFSDDIDGLNIEISFEVTNAKDL